jgi:hypothetical protein
VFDPDSATPMKPRIGATMMNAVPIAAKPLASDEAMPENIEHVGQAEDENTDQQRAPHLVERAAEDFTDLSGFHFAHRQQQTRRQMIPDARIALPPIHGAKIELRSDLRARRRVPARRRRLW